MPPSAVPSTVEILSLPARADRRDDGRGLGTPALTHPKRVVVQLLAHAGGELDGWTLRSRAAQHVRLIGDRPLAGAR